VQFNEAMLNDESRFELGKFVVKTPFQTLSNKSFQTVPIQGDG
jgi:hypothetical protein